MRRAAKSGNALATFSMLQGRPSSQQSTLAVPPGRAAKGTDEPTMPLMTSLIVPSPPAATTTSAPLAMASVAKRPAVSGPVVGRSWSVQPWPRNTSRARASRSGCRRKVPA